jgi:phage baseplate assembly protein W
MQGMDASTGKSLAGMAHLAQSVTDILTTPIGSRVMRRDYGSNLFRLVDRPMTQSWRIDVFQATVQALHRWEPRIQVQRVAVESAAPGSFSLSLSGLYLPDGQLVALSGIVIH